MQVSSSDLHLGRRKHSPVLLWKDNLSSGSMLGLVPASVVQSPGKVLQSTTMNSTNELRTKLREIIVPAQDHWTILPNVTLSRKTTTFIWQGDVVWRCHLLQLDSPNSKRLPVTSAMYSCGNQQKRVHPKL